MKLFSVFVKNFRSIKEETLYCESITCLVGANGAGKSSFLKALDLFYSGGTRVTQRDFYNEVMDEEIEIAVTYNDLEPEEVQQFGAYLQGSELTVALIVRSIGGGITAKYYGSTLQCSHFDETRAAFEIKDRSKTAKEKYSALLLIEDFKDFPAFTNKDDVENYLREWEGNNRSKCIRKRDDGQFFGFKAVAQGYLGKYTKFLLIPAVRDLGEDASERKGSIFTELMDLVVRSVLAQKNELRDLRTQTDSEYKRILDPNNLTELTTLEAALSTTLRTFVPSSDVELGWQPLADINIPMPVADVKLVEDGYRSPAIYVGHGLQRAFIMTLLQHLALAQDNAGPDLPHSLSGLIIAIEEPELYQHPDRQRHFFRLLAKLASGITPGVARTTQVLYATHSPLFIGIDRIDQLRIVRKKTISHQTPKATFIIRTSLQAIVDKLNALDNKSNTVDTLKPRMHIMDSRMSEGFFAKLVVLTEGVDDCAAIEGVALSMGHDFESQGICILPCGGKTNIDRPALVFRSLGIPTFVVWDGDSHKGETEGVCPKCLRPLDGKADPGLNRRLLRLLGATEEDWPEVVALDFACFKTDLEKTLKLEVGDTYQSELQAVASDLGFTSLKYAGKNPYVISEVLRRCRQAGKTSSTLESIIKALIRLRDHQPTFEQMEAQIGPSVSELVEVNESEVV
jgi:putative ATP-dependent endonuclease of OLD family